MTDEVLRRLEREVAELGSPTAYVKLAAELERRGDPEGTVAALFTALKAHPDSDDVRLALGRFRGPSPTEWSLPQHDARNTRRSPAKGPKGEGKILERRPLAPIESALFNRTQDERTPSAEPVPPPLLAGNYVYYSLGTGRRVLAATADGHLVAENFGASGFEWSANRDGKIAWRIHMPFEGVGDTRPEEWTEPHAVLGPDATVYGVTSLKKLIAVDPTGERRFEHSLPAKVTALALDHEREKLHVIYLHPPGVSTRDLKTGAETSWTSLAGIGVAHDGVVCDDGRLACLSPWGRGAIVNRAGELEREIRYAERIGGGFGGLSPWGDLIVVSWDPKGAWISLYDPASGAVRGGLEAPDCRGAPAIDATGTIYLEGGARYVMGYDLVTGQPRYKLDRPTLWRAPNQPASQFALREGELAFLEVTNDGVALIRAGA